MWNTIRCSVSELRLDLTLTSGQAFRWKRHGEHEWIGVLGGKVFILTQDDDYLKYRVISAATQQPFKSVDQVKDTRKRILKTTNKHVGKSRRTSLNTSTTTDLDKYTEGDSELLVDYFQLGVSLNGLYKFWSERDENFAKVCANYPGIRIMRQEPFENVLSFICSSNNNITRISSMIEKLCLHYGSLIAEVHGHHYYSFPTLEALTKPGLEQNLRDLGFGYRAGYISKACAVLKDKDPAWLHGLRAKTYEEARSGLISLPGVGPKVADCVCLMSLDKPEAVPVDTHVFQIATRTYQCQPRKTKTMTDKDYKDTANFFRGLHGERAGWAHSILFTAELMNKKPSVLA